MKYLFILLTLALSGCSALQIVGTKYDSDGFPIEIVENDSRSCIKYIGYNSLLKEMEKDAQNEMWLAEKLEQNKKHIPAGGKIIVTVKAQTIEVANTKYWEYVVQTIDGQEIQREEGTDDIPDYTVGSFDTTWWNIDTISLIAKLSSPIKIFVIDKLSQKRSSWIIHPAK
ncbi:MAG: hypothetical protein WC375_10610 [Methanomassiliicoccales archaeon]|jgi:hypothetical protein